MCWKSKSSYLTLKPHTQKKVSSIQQPLRDRNSLEIVSATYTVKPEYNITNVECTDHPGG